MYRVIYTTYQRVERRYGKRLEFVVYETENKTKIETYEDESKARDRFDELFATFSKPTYNGVRIIDIKMERLRDTYCGPCWKEMYSADYNEYEMMTRDGWKYMPMCRC